MSGARKAWMVVASIGTVEALKDQLGFCRWNYALRLVQHRTKTKLHTYNYQAQTRISQLYPSSSSSSSSSAVANNIMIMNRREKSLNKVLELNCWGPTSVRF